MAYRKFALAIGMIAASAPLLASNQEPTPATAAPAGTAETRYCLRVEPITGTRLETIQCWTREEWAQMEVDVDQEWAKEGVKVIG